MRWWSATLLVLAVALGAPVTALRADEPDPVTEGRERFKEGFELARAGRWQEALTAFQRAYALYPQPAILLNLAGAQMQTGQLVAATASYQRLLAVPDVPDELRDAAQSALARVQARTPRLRPLVDRRTRIDQVELDGTALPATSLGTDLPVDPGSHVVVARTAGRETRVTVVLAEGEARAVQVEAPWLPAPETARPISTSPHGPLSPVPARKEGSSSVLGSPWFWTVVGVVVIGGTTAAICGVACGGRDPYKGKLAGVRTP